MELLHDSRLRKRNICVVGDLNINLLDRESERFGRFTNSRRALHYFPGITRPTRFSDNSISTLLDHIWIHYLDSCMIRSGILTIDVTDHCPTFLTFVRRSITGGGESVKVSFHCVTEENRENFMAKLKLCEWCIWNINVNVGADIFTSQLNKLCCDCFPVRQNVFPANVYKNHG